MWKELSLDPAYPGDNMSQIKREERKAKSCEKNKKISSSSKTKS